MADKNLQSITFPGLTDKYVVPQVDNTLTQAGRPADAKKTGDELNQLKADISELETDIETGNLTAGTAKQLLADTGLTDKSPYLNRAMPTGAGDREEPVIVGGSVVWNQEAVLPATSSANGITITNNNDGSLTIDGTASDNVNSFALHTPWVSGHVYYPIGFPEGTKVYVSLYKGSAWKQNFDLRTINLKKATATIDADTIYFSHYIATGTSFNNVKYYPAVFDLTVTFGTAIADYVYNLEYATPGAGIAWLKKYGFFTSDYYPYTEPTFKHVEGLVSHRMVGFNQWDEDAEVGGINTANGQVQTDYQRIRSKNFIPCLPGTTYYTNLGVNLFQYDENQNFISFAWQAQGTFTTAANCHYLKFCTATNYGTTYKNDICINLSDPAKNGTYEPYTAYTYPLDPDVVLRGIPKLDASNNLYFDGDVYQPDGTVRRKYGVVDLGDLSWSSTGSGDTRFFYASITSYGFKSVQNNLLILTKYPVIPIGSSGTDQGIGFASLDQIRLRDNSYSDAAALKAGVAGQKVLYQKATPTTETADPYAPLQLADPYGTEEWVLDDEAFPMPVGQETFYPENLRAKIEGLPWNFANLIAPTEVSNVATRAYTAGQLFIVDNVLYQATTSIASGGTITPGTNCTATTLAEVISAL